MPRKTDKQAVKNPSRNMDELSEEFVILAALRSCGGKIRPVTIHDIFEKCASWDAKRFGPGETNFETVTGFARNLVTEEPTQISRFSQGYGLMLNPDSVALTDALKPWFNDKDLVCEDEGQICAEIWQAVYNNDTGESEGRDNTFTVTGLPSLHDTSAVRVHRVLNVVPTNDENYWRVYDAGQIFLTEED
jgi:hypothetical protein